MLLSILRQLFAVLVSSATVKNCEILRGLISADLFRLVHDLQVGEKIESPFQVILFRSGISVW